MKIAIAKDDNLVSEHFGHCQGFEIVQIEKRKIVKRDFIPNPGHKPGFLPKYLSEHGINIIIAGGMGAKAQELFNMNNIEVIVGAKGKIDDVLNDYIAGNLKSTNSVCERHSHHGESCSSKNCNH